MNTITPNTNYNQYNISHRGFNLIKERNQMRNATVNLADKVLAESDEILNKTRFATPTKINFLHSLFKKYFNENINKKLYKDERNEEFLKKIISEVKSPSKLHVKFIENYKGSFENLHKIFEAPKHNTSRIGFAYKIQQYMLSQEKDANQDIILELLESKNSKEYVSNYNKYSSYIKLNYKDKDVVKNLDEMVNNGTYSAKKYDDQYLNLQQENFLKKRKEQFPIVETKHFDKEIYADNYTFERDETLRRILRHFPVEAERIRMGNDEDLKELYLSTTPENYKLRTQLLRILPSNIPNMQSKTNPDLSELNKLFKRINNDKDAQDFCKRLRHVDSIKEYNAILDSNLSSSKLNMFLDNIHNIILQSGPRVPIATIQKEYANPFFETERTKELKQERIENGEKFILEPFRNFYKNLKNKIKIIIYNYNHPEDKIILDSVKPAKGQQIVNNKVDEIIAKPLVNAEEKASNEEKQIVNNTVDEIIARPLVNAEEKASNEEKTIVDNKVREIIDGLQTQAKEKEEARLQRRIEKPLTKERIIEYISNIANRNLTKQTFAKQKALFEKNANKLRLTLLPEMFASITQTKKTAQLNHKAINSSNKDVLELYMLTNGNNKKLVEYMLKKRAINKDTNKIDKTTRQFEVKEIIKTIKDAEIKIAEDKKANPKYRANDAKKYYHQLYEEKIAEYEKTTNSTKI